MVNSIIGFVKEFIKVWDEDKPARLAAGLAYYSLFALAPIMFIAISVASLFLDETQVLEEAFSNIELVLGSEITTTLENAVNSLEESTSSGSAIATIISIFALLFAASGVFTNLKYALNSIWQVPVSEYSGLAAFIKARLIAFLIVIGFGVLLIVATVAGLIISTLDSYLNLTNIFNMLNFGSVYALAVLTFGVFYKILPDTHVRWRDVWVGALFAVTIIVVVLWIVFNILGGLSVTSATEAAGAIAIVLLMIYYVAQFFLVGAEFTKVYSYRHGGRVSENESDIQQTDSTFNEKSDKKNGDSTITD